MYFEEAIVKTYYRNYKNKRVPYNQLHLKKDSEFNKNPEEPDKVAVIKLIEFKELVNKVDGTSLNEMEAKYNKLLEEHEAIKQQLEEATESNKKLSSENNSLKEDKLQLQEELIETKGKYEAKVEELSSEKDLTKALLLVRSDFLKQNAIKRFFKVEPESSKIIGKLKELPDIVEAEAKTSEENEATDS